MSNIPENEGKWYVLHTYSGYENKVLDGITKMVANMGLQDKIFEVKLITLESSGNDSFCFERHQESQNIRVLELDGMLR